MTVIQMSDRELARLSVMIDLSDERLTVEAAGTLLGLGRRQVYRLRRAFAAKGPTALVSRKRLARAGKLATLPNPRTAGGRVSCCHPPQPQISSPASPA